MPRSFCCWTRPRIISDLASTQAIEKRWSGFPVRCWWSSHDEAFLQALRG